MNAVTYRCINDDCGRGFPRQVKFCPFCGTRQAGRPTSAASAAGTAGSAQPAHTAAPAAAPPRPAAAAATAAAVAATTAAAAAAAAPRSARPANVGMQATAGASGVSGVPAAPDARGAAGAYAKADLHAPPDVELDSAPEDNAPALTPEEIAALQARLNRARGLPPEGAAKGGGAAAARPGAQPAAPQGAGAGTARPSAKPPLREPIGIGTWLLVAMILAVIWYLAKPANKEERIAERVQQAEKYTADCKLDEARAELASLRTDKAPAAQVRRVNDAINGAALGCERKRQRAKAWAELKPALENALAKPQSGALDSADSRLAAFSKKWGSDDDTRDWDKRIDGKKAERLLDEADACLQRSDRACLETKLQAAERLQRPELADRIRSLRGALSRLLEATVLEQKAPPAIANEPPRPQGQRAERPRAESPSTAPPVISTAPQTAQAAQQARKILADAERELNQGNYKGAMDKAEICATMIDVGNRECLGIKQRAERLNREMLRCVASGADWINDRCQ